MGWGLGLWRYVVCLDVLGEGGRGLWKGPRDLDQISRHHSVGGTQGPWALGGRETMMGCGIAPHAAHYHEDRSAYLQGVNSTARLRTQTGHEGE